jgi:hypothetical protein
MASRSARQGLHTVFFSIDRYWESATERFGPGVGLPDKPLLVLQQVQLVGGRSVIETCRTAGLTPSRAERAVPPVIRTRRATRTSLTATVFSADHFSRCPSVYSLPRAPVGASQSRNSTRCLFGNRHRRGSFPRGAGWDRGASQHDSGAFRVPSRDVVHHGRARVDGKGSTKKLAVFAGPFERGGVCGIRSPEAVCGFIARESQERF